MFNLFTKKPPAYSVCAECGVHFEPVTDDYERMWDNLCSTHRKPAMERYRRRNAVIDWATDNWERLEEQFKAEKASDEKNKSFRDGYSEWKRQ